MHESKESEAETARPGGHEGRKEKYDVCFRIQRGLHCPGGNDQEQDVSILQMETVRNI